MTLGECVESSGTKDGNCAAGFGVCCTFETSVCGSTVRRVRSVQFCQREGKNLASKIVLFLELYLHSGESELYADAARYL